MKHVRAVLIILSLLVVTPLFAQSQMSKVRTVWVIMMENHNWTGDDAGASFGDPDIKDNPLAPYINGTLVKISAHPEQYYNPPGNHPSQPNYLWLEAGTNFGVVAAKPDALSARSVRCRACGIPVEKAGRHQGLRDRLG